MKPKTKLIGSAGSLETLIKGINDKWSWNIEPVCEGTAND